MVGGARRVPVQEVEEPADAEAEQGEKVLSVAVSLADGVEDLVFVDVARVLVVVLVGHLPGVVGD